MIMSGRDRESRAHFAGLLVRIVHGGLQRKTGSMRRHREAAQLLNVHRNTVGAWFEELEQRGFIRMMQGPYLGPSGVGHTALWALEEVPTDDMKPPGKAFLKWSGKS